MKEYLFLFRGGDNRDMETTTDAGQAQMQKWMEWMGGLAAQGKLGPAQPLEKSGKLVKGRDKIVTDGPYMEGKEMVGGYLICKAANLDEAIELSKNCPILDAESGIVDIREIQELKR